MMFHNLSGDVTEASHLLYTIEHPLHTLHSECKTILNNLQQCCPAYQEAGLNELVVSIMAKLVPHWRRVTNLQRAVSELQPSADEAAELLQADVFDSATKIRPANIGCMFLRA